jgi:hypothetical protein
MSLYVVKAELFEMFPNKSYSFLIKLERVLMFSGTDVHADRTRK